MDRQHVSDVTSQNAPQELTDLQGSFPAESVTLLKEAENALQLLDRQVEFARAVARRSELVTVMRRARQGDVQPLRSWLHRNGQCVSVDRPAETGHVVRRQDAPASHLVDDSLEAGWEAMRQRSLMRLAEAMVPETIAGQKSGIGDKIEQVHGAGSKKVLRSLPELSLLASPLSAEGSEVSGSRKTKRRWQLSGVFVSTILHVLLIIGLGVITIAIPLDGGILDLQASESTEISTESFELTSEVAADAPSEQFETPASQLQTDVASLLASQNPTATEMFGELSPNSDSHPYSNSYAATDSHSTKNLKASFYGASAVGSSFCFLIDGSATLRGAPWEAARAELLKTLQSMSAKQRYYVIFYNKVVSMVPDRETGKPAHSPIYATRDNLLSTARWLQSLRVDTAPPGGNHTTVLQAALDLEPDAIFMLTDGEMTPGVERHVLQMLLAANRLEDVVEGEIVRTPIHTIAFHSLKGVDTMKKIAEQNHGQMTFVPKPQ